jgi:hypothetical protein
VVAGLPGLPVYDARHFGALRDSLLGSGQKEQAGEEALYRKSSVFRDGRSASGVFLSNRLSNDDDADRAVNSLNGQNFGGRNLVVNEARPQAERGGGGGGGRGGGGGGYGGGRGGHGGGGGGGGRGGHGGGGGGGRGGDRGGGGGSDRGDRGNRW